jgi:hypothetical protein
MTIPDEQMPPQEKASEEIARQVNDLLDSPEFAMAIERHKTLHASARAYARALWGLEQIPVMFEHSRHGERSSCILAG